MSDIVFDDMLEDDLEEPIKTMNLTDEELRIKVAETMGWKIRYCGGIAGYIVDTDSGPRDTATLPNYPADLNACAEFEKTLTDEEWNIYSAEIVSLTLWDRATDTVQRILQATARRRCIAFLKTKGIIP